MKVRDVIRRLSADGWYLARVRGSHRQYKHANKPGLVTVAGKQSVEVPPKTLKSIWRQAQLKQEENL
jgi:predicted RNA binding protein YcfA (HicA-like mRNA interferase family)